MQAADWMEIYRGAPPAGRRRVLLDTPAAALYLGLPRYRLFDWRRRKCGPRFLRVNDSVLYELDALNEFIDARLEQFNRLPRPTGGRLPGGRNKPKQPPESANGVLSPVERMRRFAEGELAKKEQT